MAESLNDFQLKNSTGDICSTKELEDVITKFWDSDEIPDSDIPITGDDWWREAHFVQDANARYVVKLPLKDHPFKLAESLAYHLWSRSARSIHEKI